MVGGPDDGEQPVAVWEIADHVTAGTVRIEDVTGKVRKWWEVDSDSLLPAVGHSHVVLLSCSTRS